MHGRLFLITKAKYAETCYDYEDYEIKEKAGDVFDFVSSLTKEGENEEISLLLEGFEEEYSAVVDKEKHTFSIKKENVLKAIFPHYDSDMPLKDAVNLFTEERLTQMYNAPVLESGYLLRLSFLDWVLECLVDDEEYKIMKVYDFHF